MLSVVSRRYQIAVSRDGELWHYLGELSRNLRSLGGAFFFLLDHLHLKQL